MFWQHKCNMCLYVVFCWHLFSLGMEFKPLLQLLLKICPLVLLFVILKLLPSRWWSPSSYNLFIQHFTMFMTNCLYYYRSSFFGSTVAIDAAVEEKEGMGSTQKLQVEVPDVRRTVSAWTMFLILHTTASKICSIALKKLWNSMMLDNYQLYSSFFDHCFHVLGVMFYCKIKPCFMSVVRAINSWNMSSLLLYMFLLWTVVWRTF